jgi:hypothetical protein
LPAQYSFRLSVFCDKLKSNRMVELQAEIVKGKALLYNTAIIPLSRVFKTSLQGQG